MKNGIRWAVRDRYGNQIYLTEERWQHITEGINHPEMLDYEHELQMTIRWAVRKQDTLNSQKYRYSMAFDELADENTPKGTSHTPETALTPPTPPFEGRFFCLGNCLPLPHGHKCPC